MSDVSVADIFFALTSGGCVCVPSETERLQDLANSISRFNANWVFLTPSVASTLDPAEVSSLKTLVTGGEAPTKDTVATWSSALDLIICTGPAECSIFCMGSNPCDANADPANVGWGIGGRIWLTQPDDPATLVPKGAVGELCVEGRIVARGYLNHEKKTAKSFLIEPLWLPAEDTPRSRRVYRTGDLARENLDGSFTFLGRGDDQIKVNGQRVELGEVEHTIMKASVGVKQTKVLLDTKSKALVAFVVMQEIAEDSASKHSVSNMSSSLKAALLDLRNFMKGTLPSYMVPTYFVPLRVLPLTLNTKVDVKALRRSLENFDDEHRLAYSLHERGRTGKLNDNGVQLRNLWARLLGVSADSLSADSNFIASGGNSLTAMRLISTARAQGFMLDFESIMNADSLLDMASKMKILDRGGQPNGSFGVSKNERQIAPVEKLRRAAKICNISLDVVQDVYPCTVAQEELVSSSITNPGSCIMHNTWRLPQDLDLKKLSNCWRSVSRRHDILRTRICLDRSSGWTQVLTDNDLEIETFSSLHECTQHLDPKHMVPGLPYMRIGCIPKSADDDWSYFVMTWHHALYDWPTYRTVLQEVHRLYLGQKLDSVSVQMKDFVDFTRAGTSISMSAFWAECIEHEEPAFWPPAVQADPDTKYISRIISLPPKKTWQSGNLFTLATILQTGFGIVSASFLGSHQSCYGLTLSGRDLHMDGISDLVGPTLITVPFVTSWSQDQTVYELLAQTKKHLLGVSRVSHSQDTLQRTKNSLRQFQSILVIQEDQFDQHVTFGLGDLVSAREQLLSQPFILECIPRKGDVQVNIEYDQSVLDEFKVLSFVESYQTLIAQLLSTDGTRPVNSLSTVDSAGSIGKSYFGQPMLMGISRSRVVHDLIEENIRRQPFAEAVCADGISLSYADLWQRSTFHLLNLQAITVRSGSIIPIFSHKSPFVVPAMLAILRAGAAFVLIDGNTSATRLEKILQATNSNIAFADDDQSNDLRSLGQHILPLDVPSVSACTPDDSCSAQQPIVKPNDLAYIIFTSGSTGKPKGIMIEHDNFISGALARMPMIQRNTSSRVYQFSSFAFDTSIEDILTTLLAGGCVCMPSEFQKLNDIAGSFNELRANTVDLTPSSSTLFIPEKFPKLEVLILGGEVMTRAHIQRWAHKTTLINTYGPSECSIVTTVAKPATMNTDSRNIGKACCGRVWIVDPNDAHRLLPMGALGELLIEGPTLSRGYLSMPTENEKSFVSRLRWHPTGDRLYRTGDLAALNHDATIMFSSRIDTQVKIRGQRVELGSVEAHISTEPRIRTVAVEYCPLADDRMVLVAFLDLDDSSVKPTVDMSNSDVADEIVTKVRSTLREELPGYMVPELFIFTVPIPRTMSGKIDRKKLRSFVASLDNAAATQYRYLDDTSSEQSVTLESVALKSVWSEVLDIPSSSINSNSNFFGLGGNSLSAIKLVAVLRDGRSSITVQDVFRYPELHDMTLRMNHLKPQESFNTSTLMPFSLCRMDGEAVSAFLEEGLNKCLVEDVYPCTPLQKGFMMASARYTNAYVAQHVYQLPTEVDMEKLKVSWAAANRRTSVLRTAIVFTHDNEHLQAVLKHDLETYHSDSLEEYLALDMSRSMGYGTVLSRLGLVEQDDGKKFCVLTAHHAVFDGQVMKLLKKLVTDLYRGQKTDLFDCGFNKFVQHIYETNNAESAPFWTCLLQGDKGITFPQPGLSTNSIDTVIKMKNKLPTNSRYDMVSIALAAWALTIAHYTESSDIIFGLMVSGRNVNLHGIEKVMGPTVATVPVRASIQLEQSIADYIMQMHQQRVNTIPFEQDGLEKIENIVPGSTSFNNILVIHHSEEPSLEDCILMPYAGDFPSPPSRYHAHDLVIDFVMGKDYVTLEARFNQAAIGRQKMQSILSCFGHIVEQFATAGNDHVVRNVDFCSADDRSMISSFNTFNTTPVDDCVHTLVSKSAKLHPQDTAVDGWDGKFSYGDLEERSNALAKHICSLFGPEKGPRIVPVCFRKSKYTVLSMLAILKAGAAYVPLDPSYPPLRLQQMTKQVHARFVLADASAESMFDENTKVVRIDDLLVADCLQRHGISSSVLPVVDPKDTAMIIFTSGSTGKPKGVVISHRAFSTLAVKLSPKLGLSRKSRVLQFAAHAFDVSNAEIFLTLSQGGCVCMAEEDERFGNLEGVIHMMRINWLYLTPTATSVLTGPHLVPSLETLLIGGEAARQDIIDTWASHVTLISTYGPAEATVWPSIVVFNASSNPLNIGYGDNCHMWLVQPNDPNKLSAFGSVGEILLEGPLLADSYFEDGPKTRQSFITGLAWASPDRRFYKTNDLARYDENGSMIFCGRNGTMVKLRGMRIDLGDVEYQIKVAAGPKSNVCAELLKDIHDKDTIVAFVALENTSSQEPRFILEPNESTQDRLNHIRVSLGAVLPKYMIPSPLIAITDMPRTASGKTDRKKLRQMYKEFSESGLSATLSPAVKTKVPLETDKEHALAMLWAHILKIDLSVISAHDSFFAIGGDSIKAMRLVKTAATQGLCFSVADIWFKPQLRDLAAVISDKEAEAVHDIAPFSLLEPSPDLLARLERHSIDSKLDSISDAYPCTLSQQGMIYLSERQPGAYIADFSYELPFDVDIERFKNSWQETVNLFENLRTCIVLDDRLGLIQLISRERAVDWSTKGLDSLSVIPTEGYLSAFSLQRPSNDSSFIFRLRMHHAVFDGEVVPLVLSETARAYKGLTRRTTLSYKYFVNHLQRDDVEKANEYWTQRLAGFAGYDLLSSPTIACEDAAGRGVSTHEVVLTSNGNLASVPLRLQAAWVILSAFHTGCNDTMFSVTLSGRDTPLTGIDAIAGPVVATIPLRTRLNLDETVEVFLSSMMASTAKDRFFQHHGLRHCNRQDEKGTQQSLTTRMIIETTSMEPLPSFYRELKSPENNLYHTDGLMLHCQIEQKDGTDDFVVTLTADYELGLLSCRSARMLLSQTEALLLQMADTSRQIKDLEIPTRLSEALRKAPLHLENRGRPRSSKLPASGPIASSDPNKIVPCAQNKDALELLCEILKISVDQVKANDSWFSVGGDSISAMRLAGAARKKGFKISIHEVLSASTVYEIAERISNTLPSANREAVSEGETLAVQHRNARVKAFCHEVERDPLSLYRIDARRLFENEVEDVVDTTGLQSTMVLMSTLTARGWYNYMTIDVDELYSGTRLRQALRRIFDRTPIMRSSFGIHRGKVKMIVFKNARFTIEQLDTSGDLSHATKSWIETDRCAAWQDNSSIVNVCFLRDQTKRTGRLIVCLPHFRYDGISLPVIYKDLLSSLKEEQVPQHASFADFASGVAQSQHSTEGRDFWRNLLQGSQVTRIGGPSLSRFSKPTDVSITAKICSPDLRCFNRTWATLLQAAWAAVLAAWTNSSDVVFGLLVSGRSGDLESAAEAIGPCLNIIPVRLQVKDTTTFGEILTDAHDQRTKSSKWESMSLQSIVSHCTDWPARSRMSSVVQHQNIDDTDTLMNDPSGSKVQLHCPDFDFADIWITTTPKNSGKEIKLELSYSPCLMVSEQASRLLQALVATIASVTSDMRSLKVKVLPSVPQLPELPATYPGQNDCEGSFSGNEAAPGQAELRSIASGHHHLFDKDYFASLPPPEAQIGELAAAVIFSDDLKRALNVHVTVDDALQFLQTRLL